MTHDPTPTTRPAPTRDAERQRRRAAAEQLFEQTLTDTAVAMGRLISARNVLTAAELGMTP